MSRGENASPGWMGMQIEEPRLARPPVDRTTRWRRRRPTWATNGQPAGQGEGQREDEAAPVRPACGTRLATLRNLTSKPSLPRSSRPPTSENLRLMSHSMRKMGTSSISDLTLEFARMVEYRTNRFFGHLLAHRDPGGDAPGGAFRDIGIDPEAVEGEQAPGSPLWPDRRSDRSAGRPCSRPCSGPRHTNNTSVGRTPRAPGAIRITPPAAAAATR